jgi:RNA polymerase sigma-70 factor (ECF subfamily)
MPSPPESNILRAPGFIGARDASQAADPPSPLEQEVVELFDQLRNRLLRYVFSFGLTVPDCEEVLQETFLALFQHLQGGKSRHSLRAWLFRVAHNLALKKRMRSRRDSQSLTEAMITASETVADPAPSPEDQFSTRQAQRHMMAVVEALPDLDRRCLVLRAEGLRYREIAGVLDMSLGAVSLSLGRSMARIARAVRR